MEPVRPTLHKGYRHKDGTPYSPKHDDRNGFKKDKSPENNVYMNYAALTWGGETFYDSEIAGYKECYGSHIKRHNAQRKKERHPERCIDVKQYYKDHPPEETLLYLGNKDNNVGSEVLLEVFADYREWLVSECVDNDKGCGVELLNAALHMDEATPHIQFRQMYYYTDKYGNFQISQNKALARLGFERPDMTHGIDRKNNAKVTFTAVCREKLIEIAKSHGVELITEPLPKEESGKTLDEYKAREQMKAERAEMEQDFQAREKALCAETEKAEQELAKHEQAIENAYDELGGAIENTKAEIKQNEDIICYQREEIGNQKEYIAYKQAKSNERAEQEAKKAREEREELARNFREEQNDEIIDMSVYCVEDEEEEQETQNAREHVQKAPETTENEKPIPDTPKAQTPLKTLQRRYDVDALLQQWDDDHDDAPEISL